MSKKIMFLFVLSSAISSCITYADDTHTTNITKSKDCGKSELFLNANMLTGIMGEGFSPVGFFPYGNNTQNAIITAWKMYPDIFENRFAVGANFNIPDDLDRKKPVTVILHFLIEHNGNNGTAQIQLDINYRKSDDIIGIEAPAKGFSDSQTSSTFTIVEPSLSTPNNSNLRQISVPISLDTKKIKGDWAFMQLYRIDNGYPDAIYLSTISIQYSPLCTADK